MKARMNVSREFKWSIAIIAVVFGVFGAALYGNELNLREAEARLASDSLLDQHLCLSFERYDPVEAVCKAQCATQAACAVLERNYEASLHILGLDDLKLYFYFEEEPFDDGSGGTAQDRYEQPADPNSVANRSFAIENGRLGPERSRVGRPVFGRTPDQLWEMFRRFIPAQDMPYVDEFLVLHDFNAALPDEAWVQKDGTSTWQVAINEGTAFTQAGSLVDRGNFIHTLVHETGHLMTLDDRFVDPYVSSSSCKTLYLAEGCPKENAPFARYVREFWPADYGSDEQPYGTFVKGEFVSGYAADNPTEDMAESWSAFVLFPKPEGDSIAEKKIRFFYDYPEFVSQRSHIRDVIGTIR